MPYQILEDPKAVRLTIANQGTISSVTVDLKGATVTSWTIDGREILFMSSKADRTSTKAIRGGIPLVFPQFGKATGPNPASNLPQHGFARISVWKPKLNPFETSESISASFCIDNLDLENQYPELAKVWPYSFEMEYTVCLTVDSLSMVFKATTPNRTEIHLTPLFHSYLLVEDVLQARIKGLQNCVFLDRTIPSASTQAFSGEISIAKEIDSIYFEGVGTDKLILKPEPSSSYHLEFVSTNLPDVVVWNPWVEKSMNIADLGDAEYRNFVCLELGKVGEPLVLTSTTPLSFGQKILYVKRDKRI